MNVSYHHSPLPPLPNEYYPQQPIPPFNFHRPHQYPPDPSYLSPSLSQNQQQQQQQSMHYPYPNINNNRLPQGFPQPSQIQSKDSFTDQSPLQQNPSVYHPYQNPISQFNVPNPNMQHLGIKASAAQYYPQQYSDSKKPEIQGSFQSNNNRLNPITQSRTKRSYSDNNDNAIINQNQNLAFSNEKQTYQVSVKDQLGRALAEQIEAKKRKEAAEKEENKRQELNILNFNLNNSPYVKNSINSSENCTKRTYEQSPQHLPKILANFIPRNQRNSPQIQQFNVRAKQENHQDSSRDYEDQQQPQVQQSFAGYGEEFENNSIENRRKQIPTNKLLRQVTASREVDAVQENEKQNKNQKLLEYQRFLQQQIKEKNTKKQQEKERKIQEDLRFQREFEQQRIDEILREQQQKLSNKELGGRRGGGGGRKRITSINDVSYGIQNQNIQLQKQEKSLKFDDEEQFEKLPETISRQSSSSKEQTLYQDPINVNNQDETSKLDILPQIENNDQVEVDETMVNMINMLSENQLKMQNMLNQIKQSSKESKAQNKIQFDQIQQMLLQSHKKRTDNNSNIHEME